MTYDSVYRAVVTRTDDPENRQRVRLRVPSVLGDGETAWALPLQRVAFVPAQGESVWVFFENGDLTQPVWAPGWLERVNIAPTATSEPPSNPEDGELWVDESAEAYPLGTSHNALDDLAVGNPHPQYAASDHTHAGAGHHHDADYVNEADHTLTAHTALGLSPDTHHHDADYVNEADHTKAQHTALGLADAANANATLYDPTAPTDAASTYPVGLSYGTVLASNGWPTTGTVFTVNRADVSRWYQEFVAWDGAFRQWRTHHTNHGFTAWEQHPTLDGPNTLTGITHLSGSLEQGAAVLGNVANKRTYSLRNTAQSTDGQFLIAQFGRDTANWSSSGWLVEIFTDYYAGGYWRGFVNYGYGDAGTVTAFEAVGQSSVAPTFGTEFSLGGTIYMRALQVAIPAYHHKTIRITGHANISASEPGVNEWRPLGYYA